MTTKTLTLRNAAATRAARAAATTAADPTDLAALEADFVEAPTSAFDHIVSGEPLTKAQERRAATASDTRPTGTNQPAASEPLDTPPSAPQPTIHEIEQVMAAKPASAPKRMSKPANDYLMGAVEKAAQPPSPRLKESSPQYFIELASRASMLRMAESKVGLVEAFRLTLQASAIAGPVSAMRFLSDLQRQVLWAAVMDIQRDRKAKRTIRHDTTDKDTSDAFANAERAMRMHLGLEVPDPVKGHTDGVHPVTDAVPYGLDRERDPDFIAPLTESEVIDALTELNAYLSTLLMSIVTDPNDRSYISADLGVPYTTRIDEIGGDRIYTPIYDVEEAVNVQIEANRVSMEKKRRKQAEDAIKASSALFGLLHGRAAPSANTDEPAF